MWDTLASQKMGESAERYGKLGGKKKGGKEKSGPGLALVGLSTPDFIWWKTKILLWCVLEFDIARCSLVDCRRMYGNPVLELIKQ